MSVLLTALTVHAAARRAYPLPRGLAGPPVPNPPAQAPPGMGGPVNLILGWIKYGGLIGGIMGFAFCGFRMLVGHRNRSSLAADGASALPWVVAGLTLISMSSALVAMFL
jgi:hypothetical protein